MPGVHRLLDLDARVNLIHLGVVIVPEQLEIGRAIADLEIFIECSSAADMKNQIQYLPL